MKTLVRTISMRTGCEILRYFHGNFKHALPKSFYKTSISVHCSGMLGCTFLSGKLSLCFAVVVVIFRSRVTVAQTRC